MFNDSLLSLEETSTDDYNSLDTLNEEYEDYEREHVKNYRNSKDHNHIITNAKNNNFSRLENTDSNESRTKIVNLTNKSRINMIRKRKCRTTFSKNQLAILEQEFLKYNFISNDRVENLAEITGLDPRIIKV
jgi:hypothetical protein